MRNVQQDAHALIQAADRFIVPLSHKKIAFRFEATLPRDLLTQDERAQSVCFVTKYEALPDEPLQLTLTEIDGNFYIKNLADLRNALNEFRPILMNQNDSVYYGKIQAFCRQKLTNRDKTKDLMIIVVNEKQEDITDDFVKFLDSEMKAIRKVISGFDFGYIYNGILQHSDHSYTTRYLEDYASGELNYVFLKHTLPLGYIKRALYSHHRIVNVLTFPKLGPL